MPCPSCPAGEKQTASVPPGPGVCCPTITCEPIACTINGVDYVAGETVPTINPCEISWLVSIIINSVPGGMYICAFGWCVPFPFQLLCFSWK